MKNLKGFVKRFSLLIVAMILSIMGVLKDYSYQDENQIQLVNENNVGSLNSDKNSIGNNGIAKNTISKNDIGRTIDGDSIKVMTVVDGDSLRIRINNGNPINIRLYGIDAPEYKQEYGEEATAFLSYLMNNNDIKNLQIMDIDRYDRAVVIPYLANGISVQEELLNNGIVWYYGRFCKTEPLCSQWKTLAKNAKSAKLGLWAHNSAKAPWDWKRKK